MLCRDVIENIEKHYPISCALDWDNVGLLVGSPEKEVKRVYVALDPTAEVIEAAAEANADMLVTHHPLIFSGIRSIRTDEFIGRRVIRLIQEDIAYYAMHTNYDVMRMAELSGHILGLEEGRVLEVTCPASPADGKPQGIGRAADLKESVNLEECCRWVKQSFGLDHVKVFGDIKTPVKRVAVSPGAGKSMVRAALLAEADVLVTGDIDHHTGIDAVARGLSIIDGGHYGTEHIFIRDMAGFFSERLPEIAVEADPPRRPFQII